MQPGARQTFLNRASQALGRPLRTNRNSVLNVTPDELKGAANEKLTAERNRRFSQLGQRLSELDKKQKDKMVALEDRDDRRAARDAGLPPSAYGASADSPPDENISPVWACVREYLPIHFLLHVRAYPAFYFLFLFPLFGAYFITFLVLRVGAEGGNDIARSGGNGIPIGFDRQSIGVDWNLLPFGTEGGPPGFRPGFTALQLPPQYQLQADPVQRGLVPFFYACMHTVMLALILLPLPMCHTFWTFVMRNFPSTRRHIPIDDFEMLHKALGFWAVGLIVFVGILWIALLLPTCFLDPDDPDDDIKAMAKGCAGLEIIGEQGTNVPTGSNGQNDFFKGADPWRNVAVLRLVVAPTWMSIFPLMSWIAVDWRQVENGYASKTGSARWIAIFTTPVILWVIFTGICLGAMVGIWIGAGVSTNRTVVTLPCLIAGVIGGGIAGYYASMNRILRIHWHEIVFGLHKVLGYVSVAIAVVARVDVFWVNYITWGLLVLDRIFMRYNYTHHFYIDAQASLAIPSDAKGGKTAKVRLVMTARTASVTSNFGATAATNWVYIQVPFLKDRDRGTIWPETEWHPFTVADQAANTLELMIDVHGLEDRKNEKTWTRLLFEHIEDLKSGKLAEFDKIERMVDGDRKGLTEALAEGVKKQMVGHEGNQHQDHPLNLTIEDRAGSALMEDEGLLLKYTHENPTALDNKLERFNKYHWANIAGPFGSSFSRCFEVEELPRAAGYSVPRYDIVILYGSGLGVPSALSALSEFFRRKREGTPIPMFVVFLWQCRFLSDIQLCWETLHRLIFDAGGLSSQEYAEAHHKCTSARDHLPLDYLAHKQHTGEEWTVNSQILDWLQVQLYCSKKKKAGRDQDEGLSNPLAAAGPHGTRVHDWLHNQIKPGYHELGKQVVDLIWAHWERLRKRKSPRLVAYEPRVCVSMCGSKVAHARTQEHLNQAQELLYTELGLTVNLKVELAADSQGGGSTKPPPKPAGDGGGGGGRAAPVEPAFAQMDVPKSSPPPEGTAENPRGTLISSQPFENDTRVSQAAPPPPQSTKSMEDK